MTDTHFIPDELATRTARLINEAEDMRAQAVDDLKTIYGDLREELKALGWLGQNISKEVAAFKAAISEMRLDEEQKAKREEKGDRIDDYVALLSRSRAGARARTREGNAYAEAKLVETVAAGVQTEMGRKALITAVDIMIAREEAQETQERPSTNDEASPEAGPQAEASPAGTGAGTLADREGRREGEAASVGLPTSSETPSDERETDREAATPHARANAGGGYVESSAERASVANNVANAAKSVTAGETATNSTAKPKSALRPNCRNPEACGGYGTNHCHTCLKAQREQAEEVA